MLGEVTTKAAEETGLRAGTPVVVGGPDTQCALIGSGAIAEGDVAAAAGTTTPIQIVLSRPIFDSMRRTWTCCHAVPGLWVLESNAGLTGWILRWFRDEFMEAEATLAKMTGVDVYDIINHEVEKTPIGASRLFASMGPQIFNTRDSTPPIGGLFGIAPTSRKTGKGEIARAIMENTCYAVRGNVEQLEQIVGSKVMELRFCARGIWTRIQADVLGTPLLVPEVKEASALGAAILAGIGANVYKSVREATEKAVHIENRIEPNLKHHETYDDLYHRWLRIHSKFREMVET